MGSGTRSGLVSVVAALLLSGCVSWPGTARPASLDVLRQEEGWLLVESVPFVKQASAQGCGAACLAMVLRLWENEVTAESLEMECTVPGEKGIRAAALRDAARRRGLSAFLFQGKVEDLSHELARGRPVVVGLVRPSRGGAVMHFEVVVGLHRERGRIAVLDPAAGLLSDSLSGFEGHWRAAKGVTLVVFLAEERTDLALEDGKEDGGGS